MEWEGWAALAAWAGVGATWYGLYRAKKRDSHTRAIAEEALAIQQRREAREVAALARREAESRRSKLDARIGYVPGWEPESLLIHNEGPGDAQGVKVLINGTPAMKARFVLSGPEPGFDLPAGATLAYNLAISGQTPRPMMAPRLVELRRG